MKVCIINGSPRLEGSTAQILKHIKTYLEKKDDVEILYINLSEYKITLCKGCISCYKTGKCIIKDDGIEELVDKVKNCDAIIIGSPTYGSDISSYLKAFFDRGHFIVEQSLTNKYGFSVATYEIAEGNLTIGTINKFFLVSGASRLGNLLVKLDFNKNPFEMKNLNKKIDRKIERFYKAAKNKKKKSLFERIFINVILIPIIWKPKFTKSGEKYSGVLRLWKSKGIV